MRHLLMFFALVMVVGAPAQAQFSGGGGGTKTNAPPTVAELEKFCDNGNAIACDDLGVRYLKGEVVAKDLKKSAALFQRACDGGDPVGCYDLAESYRFGDGVAKSSVQAAAFYQRGCDGGNADSCAQLAIQYNDGDGVKQDDGKTALYADRSCKGGSGMGCTLLGAVYAEGAAGYPKDIKRAEELFTDACFSNANFSKAPDNVSQTACTALAKLTGEAACSTLASLDGSSTNSCYDTVTQAWKVTVVPAPAPLIDRVVTGNSAVNAGNAAYARKDYATALAQFATSCDTGNASACGAVGNMYIRGEGVAKNGARAAAPLATACDGGIAAACGNLGTLYENGDGVSANKTRAFTLYNSACTQLDMVSCTSLGRLYENGQGIAANVAQAATLYQQSCTAGIADGCSKIGAMYAKGAYFEQNDGQAVTYFDLACSKGSQNGCVRSTEVKSAMARKSELAAAMAAISLSARTNGAPSCLKARIIAETNLAEIERLARTGLNANDPVCIHVMGWLSEQKGDYEVAYTYYLNAANKNLAVSVNAIGSYYSVGYFVQQNRLTGNEWYRRALKIAEAEGNTELAALARENIARNEAALNPSPPLKKGCQRQSVFVDGWGNPICLD